MAMAGFEVHEFLATHQKGFSPKTFDNDYNETEEEYTDVKWSSWNTFRASYNTCWPDNPRQEQREKLKQIVEALHGEDFVHGDLRAPNILLANPIHLFKILTTFM